MQPVHRFQSCLGVEGDTERWKGWLVIELFYYITVILRLYNTMKMVG
jgi:hypothetical protein